MLFRLFGLQPPGAKIARVQIAGMCHLVLFAVYQTVSVENQMLQFLRKDITLLLCKCQLKAQLHITGDTIL